MADVGPTGDFKRRKAHSISKAIFQNILAHRTVCYSKCVLQCLIEYIGHINILIRIMLIPNNETNHWK